jgi:hypothetical protein
MLNRRIATPLAGLVLAAFLATSLGCATPIYRRDYGPIVGMGGGTYDVALPGPKSRLATAGWEQTRNNDNLSEVTGADLLRAQAFPSLGGSTLARPRYLYISRSEQQMIFFGKTRRSHSVYP